MRISPPLSLSFFLPLLMLLALLMPTHLSAKQPLKVVHFSAQELKDISGHYSTIYGYLYINVVGRYVSTNFDGKHIRLIKKSNGRFYPHYKFLGIFPIKVSDLSFSLKSKNGKRQIQMHNKGEKNSQTVAQQFKATAIPQFWKQRLGRYKATLIKGDSDIKNIRLAIKSGVLVAYINKITKPYPLLASSASNLTSPSAGHNQSQAIKIVSSAKNITLQFDNNRLRLNKI